MRHPATLITMSIPANYYYYYINNELDRRMGEVSVLSMEFYDPLIHCSTLVARISQGNTECLCLLYSASSGNARDDTIAIRLNDKGLYHWRGVVWDPGIVGQQCLYVCCECLYLMALFRAIILLLLRVYIWIARSIYPFGELHMFFF